MKSDLELVNSTYSRVSHQSAAINLSMVTTGGPDVASIGAGSFAIGAGVVIMNLSDAANAALLGNRMTLEYSGNDAYLDVLGDEVLADGGMPVALITPPTMTEIFSILKPGADVAPLADLAAPNPSGLVGILDTPDLTVTYLGRGTIDGAPAHHYRVLIDDLAAEQGSTGVTQKIYQDFSSAGSSTTSLDVWIDASGLLRQLSASLSFPGYSVSFELRLFDYGTTANLFVPLPAPADEVGPLDPNLLSHT